MPRDEGKDRLRSRVELSLRLVSFAFALPAALEHSKRGSDTARASRRGEPSRRTGQSAAASSRSATFARRSRLSSVVVQLCRSVYESVRSCLARQGRRELPLSAASQREREHLPATLSARRTLKTRQESRRSCKWYERRRARVSVHAGRGSVAREEGELGEAACSLLDGAPDAHADAHKRLDLQEENESRKIQLAARGMLERCRERRSATHRVSRVLEEVGVELDGVGLEEEDCRAAAEGEATELRGRTSAHE